MLLFKDPVLEKNWKNLNAPLYKIPTSNNATQIASYFLSQTYTSQTTTKEKLIYFFLLLPSHTDAVASYMAYLNDWLKNPKKQNPNKLLSILFPVAFLLV